MGLWWAWTQGSGRCWGPWGSGRCELWLLVPGKVGDSLDRASVLTALDQSFQLSTYHSIESLGKRASTEKLSGSGLPPSMSVWDCLDC